MIPEIKHFYSPDIEGKLSDWKPNRLEEVYFLLQFDVGISGSDVADTYDILISTPEALGARDEEFFIEDRNLLVVKKYDWKKIKSKLCEIVKSCHSNDLIEMQWKLQRYFHWEYEDYKEEI